jgi:hypothetical protein
VTNAYGKNPEGSVKGMTRINVIKNSQKKREAYYLGIDRTSPHLNRK